MKIRWGICISFLFFISTVLCIRQWLKTDEFYQMDKQTRMSQGLPIHAWQKHRNSIHYENVMYHTQHWYSFPDADVPWEWYFWCIQTWLCWIHTVVFSAFQGVSHDMQNLFKQKLVQGKRLYVLMILYMVTSASPYIFIEHENQ